jgi:ribosome biogenesis GTPase / thiamine phosphate phosphatase
MDLRKIGWDNYFEEKFKEFTDRGFEVGRISSEHKSLYKLFTEKGEISGEISGKMRFLAEESGAYPAVGDWVVINIINGEDRAIIHDILPRKSKFSRKEAGSITKEQIAASNVDTVFLVNSLNEDFNLRRIERYLIVAWESGAVPVIILSKADLCEDLDEKLRSVEKIAVGVEIHTISSFRREGLDALNKYFEKNKTVVLLGSSGVGKSTLINELIGETIMETKEISSMNSKGKHTTTYRQLIVLPQGGVVIDTPGMRELQLWDGNEGISGTFEDIEGIAGECYFADCKHQKEPNCAIKKALNDGSLSPERFENYKKLLKEIKFIEAKQRILERNSSKKQKKETNQNKNYKDEYLY